MLFAFFSLGVLTVIFSAKKAPPRPKSLVQKRTKGIADVPERPKSVVLKTAAADKSSSPSSQSSPSTLSKSMEHASARIMQRQKSHEDMASDALGPKGTMKRQKSLGSIRSKDTLSGGDTGFGNSVISKLKKDEKKERRLSLKDKLTKAAEVMT